MLLRPLAKLHETAVGQPPARHAASRCRSQDRARARPQPNVIRQIDQLANLHRRVEGRVRHRRLQALPRRFQTGSAERFFLELKRQPTDRAVVRLLALTVLRRRASSGFEHAGRPPQQVDQRQPLLGQFVKRCLRRRLATRRRSLRWIVQRWQPRQQPRDRRRIGTRPPRPQLTQIHEHFQRRHTRPAIRPVIRDDLTKLHEALRSHLCWLTATAAPRQYL